LALETPVRKLATKFTVPVFLAFTFHKTLGLRGHKMADLLSENPHVAPLISR